MADFNLQNIPNYCRILSAALGDVTEQNYRLEQSPVVLSKTQFSILKILNSVGSLRVNQIAEFMQISGAAASKNIDFLFNNKLIGRKAHSKDRRMTKVSILTNGQKIVSDYKAICKNIHENALMALSDAEQKKLADLLGRYVQQSLIQEKINLNCLTCEGEFNKNCELTGTEELCHCFYKVK